MSELLERKVGIVSCSGEELPEGTVARLAALKVLNELRPRDTVTICLPLFLAGGAAKLTPVNSDGWVKPRKRPVSFTAGQEQRQANRHRVPWAHFL